MSQQPSLLSRIPGARRTSKPDFVPPCFATLADKVPERGEWCHEIKYDGYRVQAHLYRGRWKLLTRRGFDWTARFADIPAALRALPAKSAILDGEIFVPDSTGRSDFRLLQADLASGRADRLQYCIFDLLYLDGMDLRPCALVQRRELLERLVGQGRERLLFSTSIQGDSSKVLQRACQMKLEGIVSKRLDSPYRSDRQESWIKIKCQTTDSFPIIAFVEKLQARPRRIASLYLGRYEDDRLLYAGKAQTGFKTQQLYELREKLDPYTTAKSPLSVSVKKPKATWVQPTLYAEVQFSGVTADGLLRAAVYRGLRDDLSDEPPPAAARVATAAEGKRSGTKRFSRENILQLLPDATPPTWDELHNYWTRIHKQALPYLARRPLKLVRHVAGQTFYHKGALPPIPSAVHRLQIKKREGGEGVRVWIDDVNGLLGLLEMDVVELHAWNATVDNVEHADTMVIDLDPGPGISWTFLVDTALTLRELLSQEGFDSWPKLTGGKGIHVMIPLQQPMTHDAAHKRSRAIAEQLAQTDPDRFTVSAALAARRGRLFLDFLRNGRGTTAVATYSPRARPGHPIAAPTTWGEVEAGIRPDAFTMDEPPRVTRKTTRSAR